MDTVVADIRCRPVAMYMIACTRFDFVQFCTGHIVRYCFPSSVIVISYYLYCSVCQHSCHS